MLNLRQWISPQPWNICLPRSHWYGRNVVLKSRFVCSFRGCGYRGCISHWRAWSSASSTSERLPMTFNAGICQLQNIMSMSTRKLIGYPLSPDRSLQYWLLFLYLEIKKKLSQHRCSKYNHADTWHWGVSFPWSSSLSPVLGKTEMQLGSQIAVYWLSMESWHIPHMIFIFCLEKS